MNADLPPLHIFRPGRHTAMSGATIEFTAEMLAATAAAYDPAKFEAPIVVGHPATDDPAYGWVARLEVRDDGLYAWPTQVDAAFTEMVKSGRFKKISASFFTPDAPSNPVPGVYYLRHVGFLGAAAPAVKGLRHPTFSEGDTGVETLEFSTREETATVTHIDPAALEAENAQLKQQLAEFAARERAAAEWEVICIYNQSSERYLPWYLPRSVVGLIRYQSSQSRFCFSRLGFGGTLKVSINLAFSSGVSRFSRSISSAGSPSFAS